MSSIESPAILVDLGPDRAVIGALGLLAVVASGSILWAPVPLAVAVGLTVLVFATALRAIRSQCFGKVPTALRRLVLMESGDWLLEFSDGHRQHARHRAASARLGAWWFLHWQGTWAVVTARGIGEDPWRRLTARLREHGRTSQLQGRSKPRTFHKRAGRSPRPEPAQPKVRKAPDGQ
jgi:hypothetical protein